MNASAISLGLMMVIVPVALAIPFFKWCSEKGREQFERTNSHGVREYATYEDMRRDERQEATANAAAKLLIVPGIISFILGIVIIVAGIKIT